MNPLFYSIPKHDGCTNCGVCCGKILVTQHEENRIKEYVKNMPQEEKDRIKSQPNKGRICYYRDTENKRCSVYSARPMVCRLMGVANNIHCPYGNSHDIDGDALLMEWLKYCENTTKSSQVMLLKNLL
jgi:Fe-S-cluster containining protein